MMEYVYGIEMKEFFWWMHRLERGSLPQCILS